MYAITHKKRLIRKAQKINNGNGLLNNNSSILLRGDSFHSLLIDDDNPINKN
jgi:hypothetical protein